MDFKLFFLFIRVFVSTHEKKNEKLKQKLIFLKTPEQLQAWFDFIRRKD
jgi:hypothetical protein